MKISILLAKIGFQMENVIELRNKSCMLFEYFFERRLVKQEKLLHFSRAELPCTSCLSVFFLKALKLLTLCFLFFLWVIYFLLVIRICFERIEYQVALRLHAGKQHSTIDRFPINRFGEIFMLIFLCTFS